jgi:FKBP-type peptidyl-prolyl cis-trans isomerase
MRKFFALALVAIAAAAFTACDTTGLMSGDNKTTTNGLEYKIVEDKDDSVAKVGNVLELYLTVRNHKDSVLGSTYQRNTGPDIVTLTAPSRRMDLMGGLVLLSAGDSAIFYIPTDSMFAGQAAANRPAYLPAGSKLAYHIRVKNRYSDRGAIVTKQLESLKAFAATKSLKVEQDADGILYAITEKKSTKANLPDDSVAIAYKGTTLAGTIFDESGQRGPYGVILGQGRVIPGWDKGLLHFGEGDKGYLMVTSDKAYGDGGDGTGLIPPFTPLIFEIEIVKNYGSKKQ